MRARAAAWLRKFSDASAPSSPVCLPPPAHPGDSLPTVSVHPPELIELRTIYRMSLFAPWTADG